MGSVKAVKVEFAFTDDLKSATSTINSETAKLNKTMSDYEAAYKVMRSAAVGVERARNELGKVISIADGKAKELGVSPSAVSGYSEANKAWSTGDAALDKVNEF